MLRLRLAITALCLVAVSQMALPTGAGEVNTPAEQIKRDRPYGGHDYSIEEIVDMYVAVALSGEVEVGASGEPRVRKWRAEEIPELLPLPLDSLQNNNREHAAAVLVKAVADTISLRIGHQVFRTFSIDEQMEYFRGVEEGAIKQSNTEVPVFIGNHAELEEIRTDKLHYGAAEARNYLLRTLRRAKTDDIDYCSGMTVVNPISPEFIYRDFVFIESSADREACLYEELIQGLGLFDDLPDGTPSIFNDDHVYSLPTKLDWTLLTVHLDSRIHPGMTEAEVRPVARKILSETMGGHGGATLPLK